MENGREQEPGHELLCPHGACSGLTALSLSCSWAVPKGFTQRYKRRPESVVQRVASLTHKERGAGRNTALLPHPARWVGQTSSPNSHIW